MSTTLLERTANRVHNNGSKAEPWKDVIRNTTGAFRMTAAETDRMLAHSISNLIAALPFIAGCENPERTASAHLGVYLLSCRNKEYYNHAPEDDGDIFDRLALINQFNDGDRAVIRKGMSLLALNMISDYNRDRAEDLVAGKYNPLTSGAFSYGEVTEKLLRDIEAVRCPDIDEIITASEAFMAWWKD